jgi:hypothetical protein
VLSHFSLQVFLQQVFCNRIRAGDGVTFLVTGFGTGGGVVFLTTGLCEGVGAAFLTTGFGVSVFF